MRTASASTVRGCRHSNASRLPHSAASRQDGGWHTRDAARTRALAALESTRRCTAACVLLTVFFSHALRARALGRCVAGAVEAPGWVLPVGGLLAVLTALLPVLLAPGDEALQRQRSDEAKVAGKNNAQVFGRGRRD